MALNPNTKLLLHFDDNVNDATGNHNPAAQNSPSYTTGDTNFNNCIDLNGSNQYVTIADSDDFYFSSGDFTIDLKYRPDDNSNDTFMGHYTDASNYLQFYYQDYTSSTVTLVCKYYNSTENIDIRGSVPHVAGGDWYHAAIVRYGNEFALYHDGSQIDTQTSSVTLPNLTSALAIGRPQNYAGDYFNGRIDEVRIVKGEAIWTGPFDIPTYPYGTSSSGDIATSLYAIGNTPFVREGKNFTDVITSMSLNRIYEGQYTQDSNARIYGSIEPQASTIGESGVLLMHFDNDVVDAMDRHNPSAIGSPSYTTSQSGFDKAIYFNGSTQYVSIPDSNDWNFGTNDLTIDFVIKWNTVASSSILGQDEGGGNNLKWFINWNGISSSQIAFHYQNPAGSIKNVLFTWTPVVDTWYHLAFVKNGNNWYFFVDGVQTGGTQVQSVAIPSVTSFLAIGQDGEGWQWLDGNVDEVRINNGQALWTSNFDPPTSPYNTEYNKIKFYADAQKNYQIAEYDAVAASGIDVVLTGDGYGVGLSGVFSYEL